MKKLFLTLGIIGIFLLSSCSNDDFSEVYVTSSNEVASTLKSVSHNQDLYLLNFAGILSKVTYDREDVREFLKTESLKQFDKNYDVLYLLVKEKMVGEKSFRDILVSYSSEEAIEEIEESVPLLNILIPEIPFFDISPKNMDIKDEEIPVTVSQDDKTSLFINGKVEADLEKGEVPDFHVFVVNENSRVVIPQKEARGLKMASAASIMFKSPNFDGSIKQESPMLKSATVSKETVGAKAIKAYSYFNQDNGSIYQRAFQRDYIYYGITPQNQKGSLNRAVSEYVSFIEINPRTYFKIADQKGTGSTNDDPYIKETSTSQKKRELTEAELMDRLWTKGAYDLRFEIVTSTSQRPEVKYIPLKPNEIWNFNLEHTKRHKTAFRHSKHTYRIDPNNFTAKRVYLSQYQITFGKWDLSEESIYRYINVLEEDESIESTFTTTYETTRVHTSKFSGDAKLEIGIGKAKVNREASAEVTDSNTIKDSKTVTIVRKEKSDDLGTVKIFFYDPIIERKSKTEFGIQRYVIRTYTTGHVTFGLSVK
jgi:hypothetical protein